MLFRSRAVLEPAGDDTPAAVDVELWVTRLTGRGDICGPDGPVRARQRVEHGVTLRIGSSTCCLTVEHGRPGANSADAVHRPCAVQHGVVVRSPRVRPEAAELALVAHVGDVLGLEVDRGDRSPRGGVAGAVPELERPGGLVPTLVGLLGSSVVALVTHRPMFLLFGALGSTVALTSWVGQWVAFRRRHRRDTAHHRATVADDARSRAAARSDRKSTRLNSSH